MDILTDTKLIERIEAFIARHDQMSATRFGRETMNDPDLLRQLKAGRSLSLKNAEKLILFMENYTPPFIPDESAEGAPGNSTDRAAA